MRTASALLLISLVLGGTGSAAETLRCDTVSSAELPETKSFTELRARGPAGLQELFKTYELEVNEVKARTASDAALSPRAEKVRRLLDQVAQQKDAYSSGLY